MIEEITTQRKPASPYKVYPAWGESFDTEWRAPLCDCGSIAPRDGTHRCDQCRHDLGIAD